MIRVVWSAAMTGLLSLAVSSAMVPTLRAQDISSEVESLLRAGDPDVVRQRVAEYIAKHRGTASAIYLEAVFEPDAERALELYETLLFKYPTSAEADDALYRVAHYYFARGLYISARDHFRQLIEKYPESARLESATYFAASCLRAAGQTEAYEKALRDFQRQFPDSRLAERLPEEGIPLSQDTRSELITAGTDNGRVEGKYTLQVGAFSQINHALKQRSYFEKLGMPVEIREKDRGGRTLYLVWVGRFGSKAAAESFGDRLRNEHGKLYRVVELNK